jgi:hypothetical protein
MQYGMSDANASSSPSKLQAAMLPCLNCGCDLRAAKKPGASELRCSKCGRISAAHRLFAYGFHRAKVIQLVALVVASAILVLTSATARFATLCGTILFGAWGSRSIAQIKGLKFPHLPSENLNQLVP